MDSSAQGRDEGHPKEQSLCISIFILAFVSLFLRAANGNTGKRRPLVSAAASGRLGRKATPQTGEPQVERDDEDGDDDQLGGAQAGGARRGRRRRPRGRAA